MIITNYGGIPDVDFVIPDKVTQQRVDREREVVHLSTQRLHNKVEKMLILLRGIPELMTVTQRHTWRHAVLLSRHEHHVEEVEDERRKRKAASDEQRAVKAKRSHPAIGIITAASLDLSDEDDIDRLVA